MVNVKIESRNVHRPSIRASKSAIKIMTCRCAVLLDYANNITIDWVISSNVLD